MHPIVDVPPGPLELYIWGVIGSIGVELITVLAATVANEGKCPLMYRQPFYIALRTAVAFVAAGALPVGMHAANTWSALYLGASAPLVYDRLQRGGASSAPKRER